MRIIVDTNVFVSAALKEGSHSDQAVRRAAGNDLLLKSTMTEQELFITLARPRLVALFRSSFENGSRRYLLRPNW